MTTWEASSERMRSVSAALSSLNATWAAIRDREIIRLRRPMFSSNKTLHWNSLPVFLCLFSLCSSSPPPPGLWRPQHTQISLLVLNPLKILKTSFECVKRGSSLWGADPTSNISVCVRKCLDFLNFFCLWWHSHGWGRPSGGMPPSHSGVRLMRTRL